MSNRAIRLTISILLVVSVLCCSFSVFADNEIDEGTSQYLVDQWLYYIWLTMNAWGLNVTLDQLDEYNDAVEEWMLEQVELYLSTQPSINTVSQWILPWRGNEDSLGIFTANSNFLQDVQDFVNWLTGYHNVEWNALNVVDAVEYIVLEDEEKKPIYVFTNSYGDNYSEFTINAYLEPSSFEGIEVGPVYKLASGNYLWIEDRASTYYVLIYVFEDDTWNNILYFNTLIGGQGSYEAWKRESNNNQLYVGYNGTNQVPIIKNNASNVTYDYSFVQYYTHNNSYSTNIAIGCKMTEQQFNSYFRPATTGLYIDAGTNNIPSDNDIGNGESLVIYDDGEAVYIEIEWPESISVDNLPAIVSTSTIDNPHMEEAYQPVQGLIEMTKDGVELMHGIVNELPGEAVTCIYALIGAVIVFGMIKLMREH